MGYQLVSIQILLAAYQGEKYLPELLRSLSAQTEEGFRVLWQDDGSTDGTARLLSAWGEGDPRFQPGRSQGHHLGPAGNFLSLLRQSDAGELLLCDQDDIWEREKVDALHQALAKAAARFGGDTPILVHSDCSVIDEAQQVLSPSFFRLEGWDPQATTLPRLLVQNNVTGCTVLLNRPLADLVCRYGRAGAMFMHDWFIALTAASFGQVVFLDRPLTRYRQHEGNTIGASRASLLHRAVGALGDREKAKARIRLTYTHAKAFRQSFGASLPAPAASLIDAYLATEGLPRFSRIRAVRHLGCVMQSPVTRAGQILFG